MLKRFNWNKAFDFLTLIQGWKDIVGPLLAEQSTPLKIKQQTLFILTRHAAFSQEINYQSEAIKKKIETKFPELKGKIQQLAFETSESFFKEVKSQKEIARTNPDFHPQSPRYRAAYHEAEEIFAGSASMEEKEKWISLYIQTKLTSNE
jgi:hypothetical protein